MRACVRACVCVCFFFAGDNSQAVHVFTPFLGVLSPTAGGYRIHTNVRHFQFELFVFKMSVRKIDLELQAVPRKECTCGSTRFQTIPAQGGELKVSVTTNLIIHRKTYFSPAVRFISAT